VIAESALNPLSVFEYAQIPEEPEPAKRLLFSAFAGAATGAIGVFLIFMTLLFDTSFHSPQQFERLTGVPLLGFINQVKRKKLDLQEVFNGFDNHISINQYKESLRRIRYSIEQSGAKRFLFTSTQPHSGKTFTVLSLAYSLSKKNHRVAVLDTNFKHNNLTRWANTDTKRNPLLTNGRDAFYDEKRDRKKPLLHVNGEISIIGSVLSGDSPSEIFAGKDFEGYLNALEQKYDYILMEGAAMNEYSDSQELVEYAEKVIAVFEAEDRLRRADKESIVFLQSLNDKFMGGILNQVNLKQLDDVS
jgi:Mrp family chromosome partitioning ATPase